MLSLSAHSLAVLPRPGDGACFYWSAGTGMGYYDATSFDLLGNGGVDDSPIWNAQLAASMPLLKQMRADRNAVVAWLLEANNAYIIRAEYGLWTDPKSMKKRSLFPDRATWKPPRGVTVDAAKVNEHGNDTTWAACAQIKAYAALKGVDIVVLEADQRGNFHDSVNLYMADGDEVQTPCSFIAVDTCIWLIFITTFYHNRFSDCCHTAAAATAATAVSLIFQHKDEPESST